MTVTLIAEQVIERCTVTLTLAGAASLPSAIIIIDGKAYTGLWTSGSYVFTYDLALERGPHTIYAQATDSVGTVTTVPITYVMAYENTEYGIDVYSGDALLDAIGTVLRDELLPGLPTLNFSCATLLTGTIQAVIRERGLRQYQFTVATVGASNRLYQYTCKAAESYALTTAILALQTAYGSTANAIRLLASSLNIINAELLAQTTYPQLYQNITPTEIIKQLLIQSLAQASVRNGNLYVFPLDVSAQIPDYHMQRLDPLTGWQKDADTFDAVTAHYLVKQYPTPDTALTLHDAANWVGAVTDVTQVADTLLPVPSGALRMLKSVGNCSKASLNAAFGDFDRIRFNWLPVTAAYVDISLQQDGANKLDLRHYWAGQQGAGFVLGGAGVMATDTVTEDISCDDTSSGGTATKFVTTVEGTTTGSCSYRVTLLDAADAVIWQDEWVSTFGNTFKADVPTSVSQTYQATTVRIEFKDTYLIAGNYGVQVITCDITVQSYIAVGTHESVVSSATYHLYMDPITDDLHRGGGYYPVATGAQWYEVNPYPDHWDEVNVLSDQFVVWWHGYTSAGYYIYATVVLRETITDYAWVSAPFSWSAAFNLFESVDIALSTMTRTGNPVNLATIALTFSGDNYVDTLVLVADNPLPVTVRAGMGSRAYPVTDDFGSEAGAQAYADGLLPIVSVAREQYTRDVSLATDLSVGDTINGDGTNMTVYAIDYRQDGKTVAAGKAMDTLMTRLGEQARRLGTLERKA